MSPSPPAPCWPLRAPFGRGAGLVLVQAGGAGGGWRGWAGEGPRFTALGPLTRGAGVGRSDTFVALSGLPQQLGEEDTVVKPEAECILSIHARAWWETGAGLGGPGGWLSRGSPQPHPPVSPFLRSI